MAVRVGTKPAPRWVEMARRHEGREELRLSDALQPWLTAALARTVSKSLVRRLVIAGAVSVDGETVRNPTLLLRGGASVRARVDSTKLPQGVLVDRVKYLHQDADLLVVDKPAGLPMHAGADPNRPNLVDAIGKQLRAAGEDPYLGVHQRLDRDTSGVVLFARRPEANAALAEQFARRSVAKVYWALVESHAALPESWSCDDAMPDGREAVTAFRTLASWRGGGLVEARPATGRKHQIRIHLASAGRPIRGDVRYGARANGPGRVMLHAHTLQLRHPATGAAIVFSSEPPADFAADRSRAAQPRPAARRPPEAAGAASAASSKRHGPPRVGRFKSRDKSRTYAERGTARAPKRRK